MVKSLIHLLRITYSQMQIKIIKRLNIIEKQIMVMMKDLIVIQRINILLRGRRVGIKLTNNIAKENLEVCQ